MRWTARVRRRLIAALAGVSVLSATSPHGVNAATPVSPFSRTITLRQMLIKGLKARRPIEFEYLNEIVRMVDERELPEHLVRGTFFWAYQRYVNPLQYFQEALSMRAAKIGLYAPGFDSPLSTAIPTPPGQFNNGDTGNPDNSRAVSQ